MTFTQKRITSLLAAGFLGTAALQAYDWKQARKNLTARQQSIAQTAALAAVGRLDKLEKSFNQALENGLSVNELKEIILQLYAYTGFPRCLNAAGVLESVLAKRQAEGRPDITGPQPRPIPAGTDKYELGKKNLEVLLAAPLPSHPPVFIQATDTFLKEHLFADIFARGVLPFSEREMATVAALAALGDVTHQLQAHIAMALNVGVTPEQLAGIMGVIQKTNGRKIAQKGLNTLQAVLQSRQTNAKG